DLSVGMRVHRVLRARAVAPRVAMVGFVSQPGDHPTGGRVPQLAVAAGRQKPLRSFCLTARTGTAWIAAPARRSPSGPKAGRPLAAVPPIDCIACQDNGEE